MRIPFIAGTILLVLFCLMGGFFAGAIIALFGDENIFMLLTATQIGMWLLPALLYAGCFYNDFLGDLNVKNFGKPANHGWFILLYLISIPMVGYLYEISQAMPFPEYLVELSRKAEAETKEMVLGLVSGGMLKDFISALLVMAVLPAICEEVFFRGVVLNNLVKRTSRIHLSVWLSAILFSAVHFEILGFFSRVLMGAVLGYAFVLSKSLWIPIILHFLNNGILVAAYFFYQKELFSEDPSEVNNPPVWLAGLCLIAGVVLLQFLLKRYNSRYGRSRSYRRRCQSL